MIKTFASALFAAAARARAQAYRRGFLPSRRLRDPVISVGNLTVGGTGKTPFVLFLARILRKAGHRPAVLSRGYKGRFERDPHLIQDEKGLLYTPEECGDEPYLLAQKLPGTPVAVGADRYRAGRLVEERFAHVIHLLDDGFQHLALRRNLDILLLDATDPFGGGRTLPAGRLREPLSALQRADLVVITRSHLPFDGDQLEETIRRHNRLVPICYCYHDLIAFRDLRSGESHSTRHFFGRPVLAFCGLGNPTVFRRDLAHYQLRVLEAVDFPDHHAYSQNDLQELRRRALRLGAEALVTTEKDGVRLAHLDFGPGEVFAAVLEVRAEDTEEYRRLLVEELENLPPPH